MWPVPLVASPKALTSAGDRAKFRRRRWLDAHDPHTSLPLRKLETQHLIFEGENLGARRSRARRNSSKERYTIA